MHDHNQHMPRCRPAHQPCPKQVARVEVERSAQQFLYRGEDRGVSTLAGRHRDVLERKRVHRQHLLRRLPVYLHERCAQRLMAAYHFSQRRLQRRDIQRPLNLKCHTDVVTAAVRLQLVQKPQPFLVQRQRR